MNETELKNLKSSIAPFDDSQIAHVLVRKLRALGMTVDKDASDKGYREATVGELRKKLATFKPAPVKADPTAV